MPLFGLETEATAFIGEGGQSALRLEAEYDILLTQRWVLQPTAELNLHGRNDEARGVGAGFSDASLGLRLRYEISRQFAPYIGVTGTVPTATPPTCCVPKAGCQRHPHGGRHPLLVLRGTA